MQAKNIKLAFALILVFVFSLGLSFSFRGISAVWNPPTSTPPDGNVPQPINVGSNDQYKSGGLGLDRVYSTTSADHLYIDSDKGVQIRLDKDGNNLDSATTFQINRDDNTTVFSVDENGKIRAGGKDLLPECLDGQVIRASSTAPSGWDCANGFTYGS